MMAGAIEGATRIMGSEQGYHALHVRDEVVNCMVNGPGTPCMTTAWLPTPKELEALVAGASIRVSILGTLHPPLRVEVGPLPGGET